MRKILKARKGRNTLKRVTTIILLLTFVGFAAGVVLAAAEAPKGKPQTICPVMGGDIDKSVYADYEGKRVYFCCDACRKDFQKNPAMYIKKMEDQGIILEKTPAPK
jgi:YHS domain-containing protein